MMKDIIVKIDRLTSQVYLNKKTLGISGENLQGNIVFEFIGEFVDGVVWLEIETPNNEKYYLECMKHETGYYLPILSSLLTTNGNLRMQLRITEGENAEGIPVFKSNIFYLEVKDAIDSTATIPEEYPTLIDIVNTKLEAGNIIAGENVTIETSGMDVIINSTGGGNGGSGTSDYEELENKPQINGVELFGNKTLQELGYIPYDDTEVKEDITNLKNNKADKSEIPNVSNFITNSVDNLANYYDKGTVDSKLQGKANTSDIPTKISSLENDEDFISKEYTGDKGLLATENKADFVGAINELKSLLGDIDTILATLTTVEEVSE